MFLTTAGGLFGGRQLGPLFKQFPRR